MNPFEMTQGINHALLETTMASTAALLLVLMMRRRMRAAFGAAVAYAAWLLVPIASIAVLLPAIDTPSIPVAYRFIAAPMQLAIIDAAPTVSTAAWLSAGWLLGAFGMLAHFIRQQRRFQASLGRLQARGVGVQQADATTGLPAAIGWLKPMIVLPADFDTRYDTEQRALMLAHERAHVRHGDLQANATLLLMRCVFWFNPLLHLGARAFRHDQELACDQRVIARYPGSRRAYGEAMFRTQLATQTLPLGCHWGFTHPLKERIDMLVNATPSATRRAIGASLVTTCLILGAAVAWAVQPSEAGAPQQPSAVPVTGQSMAAPAYPKDALAKHIGGDGKAIPSRVRVPVRFDPDGEKGASKDIAPARLGFIPAAELNTYERMLTSMSASWMPPKPPQDEC